MLCTFCVLGSSRRELVSNLLSSPIGCVLWSHCTNKESEPQRSRVIGPRSHSWQTVEWGLGPPLRRHPAQYPPGGPSPSGRLSVGLSCGNLGCPCGTTLDPLRSPPANSGAQTCVTATNRTGFLCHDRRSCIPASRVCDGVRTCAHGEDEDEAMCREYLLRPALPHGAPPGPGHGCPQLQFSLQPH